MSADYSLTRALPPDVALGGESIAAFYQRYPIFSWPWVWRRFILFAPFALVPAVIEGMSHGALVEDVRGTLDVTWRFLAANVVAIGAGPLAAMFVRHAHPAPRAERWLVTLMILVGLLTAFGARGLANDYHNGRMMELGLHGMSSPQNIYTTLQRALDIAMDWLYLYIAGAGLALHAYRTESMRWHEHQRLAELETLHRQRDAADMQLSVLQAQVEPHFLFNTLASVRSLVAVDPKRAADTIDALAEHLRATLPKLRAEAGTALSTLGEQFAICESYLKVMRVRMGNRVRTIAVLPDELRALPFPPLMLISLVENAIKHGVEPKAGAAEVRLEAFVRASSTGVHGENERTLEVRVSDDGVGLSVGMGEGTGLANIRAQLHNRFGDSAALTLTVRETGGLIAALSIPMERIAA